MVLIENPCTIHFKEKKKLFYFIFQNIIFTAIEFFGLYWKANKLENCKMEVAN